MALFKSGNNTITTLGEMVGFLLCLYVLDQLIAYTLPLSYSCGTGFSPNITAHNCYLTTDTTITKTIPSQFAPALTFIQSLMSAVGLLGMLEITYKGLRRAKMI